MAPEDHHLPAGVRQLRIDGGKTAADVGDFVIASFQEIGTALSPVVGDRGVVALLDRSVQLAARRHPWLGQEADAPPRSLDLAALRTRFSEQPVTEAVAGGSALLHTFRTLLSTLIGASLAEKLLGPAWSRFDDDADAREKP